MVCKYYIINSGNQRMIKLNGLGEFSRGGWFFVFISKEGYVEDMGFK